jgi:hypothetical protein
VIPGAARYRDVRPGSGIVPSHLVGRIEGGAPRGGRVIAVALNGRIAATGRTFTLEGAHAEQFSLLIPERRFRTGRNRLVLLLAEHGTARRLYRRNERQR